jgi:hypothetical protein
MGNVAGYKGDSTRGIRMRRLVTCHCGAVYERTERRLSFQVVGDFWCECGEVLESWNGWRVPVYVLAQHENVTQAAA